LGARCAEGAEEDAGVCGRGELGGPGGGVGRGDGLQFCGACWVGEVAARVGVDGGEGGVCEERGEDVGALRVVLGVRDGVIWEL